MSLLASGIYTISHTAFNWPIGINNPDVLPAVDVPIVPLANTTIAQWFKFERTSATAREATGYFTHSRSESYVISKNLDLFASPSTSKDSAPQWVVSAQFQHGEGVYIVSQVNAPFDRDSWSVNANVKDPSSQNLFLSLPTSTRSFPPQYNPRLLFKFTRIDRSASVEGRALDELD